MPVVVDVLKRLLFLLPPPFRLAIAFVSLNNSNESTVLLLLKAISTVNGSTSQEGRPSSPLNSSSTTAARHPL